MTSLAAEEQLGKCPMCYDTTRCATWLCDPCIHFVSCDVCMDKFCKSEYGDRCPLCRHAANGYKNVKTGQVKLVSAVAVRQEEEKDNNDDGDAAEEDVIEEMDQLLAEGDQDYLPSASSSDDDEEEPVVSSEDEEEADDDDNIDVDEDDREVMELNNQQQQHSVRLTRSQAAALIRQS